MTKIGIILGSTRPGRKAEAVAKWVHENATARNDDATYELLDLAEFDLPILDEPMAAAMSTDYAHQHTKRWSEAVAACDGFVVVTPEYNHSMSGALKNALDFLYVEWHNKAVGFVGYGLDGAPRAIEHLRLIAGELRLADVRDQVSLGLFTDFVDGADLAPVDYNVGRLTAMLDGLVLWSQALATVRR